MKKFKNSFYLLFGLSLALSLASAPSVCHAHSLYIQSSRYKVNVGKQAPLFFCYGHHIPVDDGVRGKKLKSVEVLTPSGKVEKMTIRQETGLQSYMVPYQEPGTYVLSAETNPGYYTIYIDKKGRDRHAVKPKSAVMENAKEITTSLHSKQFTKTYVVCQAPSEKFPARIGQRLELVPTSDITQLKAGDTLELQVYFDGKPYEGEAHWDATYNGFSTESEDNFYPRAKTTGSTLKIFIPRPGRWFVRYYIKTEPTGPEKEHCLHLKNTATLVFQIDNQPKRTKSSSH
ncbi:hypothetical protein AAU61_17415 [Desulfocarbo indianensis]|nr:hypothetical protein AAU61_17415 [Desulfocarbo indianensis]